MADADQDETEGDRIPDLAAASGASPSFFRRLTPWLAGAVVSVGLGAGAGVLKNKRDEAKGDEPAEKHVAPSPEQFPRELKLDLGKTVFNCADNGQLIAGAVTVLLEVRTNEKWGGGEHAKPGCSCGAKPRLRAR